MGLDPQNLTSCYNIPLLLPLVNKVENIDSRQVQVILATYSTGVYTIKANEHERTHTHPFNGPYSGTTRVSQYQKVKTNLDFTEARDIEWKWHQLGHMQVCTSLQTDNHASTPPLSFFTGRMPFLPPNQQSQSTGHIQHWRIYDKSK